MGDGARRDGDHERSVAPARGPATLDGAEDAFLCVAFVQEKGLHLLEKELEALRRRGARSRLLVTTTFQTTSPSALSMASGLGPRRAQS